MTTHARVLGWSVLFWFAATAAEANEPERIEVQHILVGFQGSIPGKAIVRSKKEAERIANDIFKKARKKGADFDALLGELTDDKIPGIYKMANKGVTPAATDEYPRERMVAAFGEVGFKLKVGEVGLAKFDAQKSPYGFHIIKRLK